MSTASKPSSDYDGKVTVEQVDELERLRIQYENSRGTADEGGHFQKYHDYATSLLIDLSGKLEPGSDQEPGGGDGGGGKPSDQLDNFGIVKIYKDKEGGQFNTTFKGEQKMRNYASGKKSEWSYEYTATARSEEENSDIEVTLYEKINNFKTNEPDSISDKLTGPNHSDGKKSWVIPDFMTDGSAKKTLETENPHPKNKGVNPAPLTKIGGSLIGKWFGHKAITFIKNDVRYVESWIHFPVTDIDNVKTEQDKWRQYLPRTKIDDSCKPARGRLFTTRIDGIKKDSIPDFKYCSVREITPPEA